MKFSDSQLKAINHKEGPAIVLAVPGSGKTTVLISRINQLIEDGVSPNAILSLTFSKSQAVDMQNRFNKIYKKENVKFSTIHSFSYGILRSFYKEKPLEIIESSNKFNKYQIVKNIFFRIRRKKITDEQLENFFRVSSFLKNTLMDYDEYKKMYSSVFTDFEKVYYQYEEFKKKNFLIDFDDMLLETLKLLKNDKKALNFLQNKFKYIQIDEGQDTSYVQLKIISLIAKPNNNLFIVADDDQSIYGFRGANSNQLLDFPKNYPDTKIYYMENNYRSTKNIAKISNKLIENNKIRYDKKINAILDHGANINILSSNDTREQTEYVIEKSIEKIRKNESVAILYKNNISSINYLDKIPEDINYYIKDVKIAFFYNQIIIDIINIIYFSKDQYDMKLFEKIYYKLNLFIKKDFIKQIKYMDENISIVERLKECEGVNEFFLEKIYLLSYYMDKLSDMNFERQVKYILFDMDYYQYLLENAKRTSTSVVSINRSIDTLLNIIKEINTVKEFENKVNYLIKRGKKSKIENSNLTLSTIHASKGLEFDNVFIIDMVDNEFPSSHSKSSDDNLGVLEEERRLFYVAMTRAKHNLTIIYPKILYNKKVKRSEFIDELLN